MPVQNVTVVVPAGVWTQLTPADATAIRVQNLGFSNLWLMATIAAGPAPAVQAGAIFLKPGDRTVITLATEFVGITLATRLWAYSDTATNAAVSNA